MSAGSIVTPRRRDALFLFVAFSLLTAPLWTGAFDLGEPVYTYERFEVVASDDGIEYDDAGVGVWISEDIACLPYSDHRENRLCAYESYLAENETTIRAGHSTGPGDPVIRSSAYRYVALADGMYEPTLNGSESAEEETGFYPFYLELEETTPEAVLEDVSLASTGPGVPPTIGEAAESGIAQTRSEVEIPRNPIETEDGSYYRIYRTEIADPPLADALSDRFARFVAPFVGLWLLYRVSRRVRVTYVRGNYLTIRTHYPRARDPRP